MNLAKASAVIMIAAFATPALAAPPPSIQDMLNSLMHNANFSPNNSNNNNGNGPPPFPFPGGGNTGGNFPGGFNFPPINFPPISGQ